MNAPAVIQTAPGLALYERMCSETWMAAARADFRPGAPQPCEVCGRHRAIAHAHHLVPLATQYATGRRIPSHEMAWLCPNHHAAVHLLLSQANSKRAAASRGVIALIGELIEADELTAVLRIAAKARLAHADALEAEVHAAKPSSPSKQEAA